MNPEFQAAVQEALKVRSWRDIAHHFGASKTTVERWRDGVNEPHPALHASTIADLKQMVAEAKKP